MPLREGVWSVYMGQWGVTVSLKQDIFPKYRAFCYLAVNVGGALVASKSLEASAMQLYSTRVTLICYSDKNSGKLTYQNCNYQKSCKVIIVLLTVKSKLKTLFHSWVVVAHHTIISSVANFSTMMLWNLGATLDFRFRKFLAGHSIEAEVYIDADFSCIENKTVLKHGWWSQRTKMVGVY